MKIYHTTKSRSFSSNRHVITFIIFVTCLLLAVVFSFAQSNQRGADDIVNIPDANLKAYLVGNSEINLNGDGEITQSEALNFTGVIHANDLGITDATGIEAFTLITGLYLGNNDIGSIDVSNSIFLEDLYLRNTGLTTLDITNLAELDYLEAELNDLTVLDISQNTKLTNLQLQSNDLTSIDLSQNTMLRTLRLHHNDLSSVDLSNNTEIRTLLLNGNTQITTLDVSMIPNLQQLSIENLQISSLNLSANTDLRSISIRDNDAITELDLSSAPNLAGATLWFCDNLESVNLRNGGNENITSFNSQNTPMLTCIAVDDVAYSIANWTFIDAANEFKAYCDPNDPVHIPDANFKAALVGDNSINTNEDTEISFGEAEAYNGIIDVENLEINDLTGIEAFVNITQLDANRNNLTSVDISQNTALTHLFLWSNNLQSIDLSNNSGITNLNLNNNPLGDLDVSMQSGLFTLQCGTCDLNALDLSNNTGVQHLIIPSNNLTTLDLSTNPLIFNVILDNNSIVDLTLPETSTMKVLRATNNSISSLDLAGHGAIETLSLFNNDLNSLNLQNGTNDIIVSFDISSNPNLTCVAVDDPAYSRDNWENVDLQTQFRVDCDPNAFIVFPDANFKAALVAHDPVIDTNGDMEISYGEAEAFVDAMDVASAGITDMTGIEYFTEITSLSFGANDVVSLDVSNNLKLTAVSGGSLFELASLDLGANQVITYVGLARTKLTSLDLTAYSSLTRISLNYNNLLTDLNVTGLTNLETLTSQFGVLTSIDVSTNTALTWLELTGNGITSLDITGHPDLIFLEIDHNPVGQMDLTANTNLTTLGISFCGRTSLDVSHIPTLQFLYADGNDLTSMDLSNNASLKIARLHDNLLESLNLRNGNNAIINEFNTLNNPNLTCVLVDDADYSTTNWTEIDAGLSFSDTYCNPNDPVHIPDAIFKTRLLGIGSLNSDGDPDEISYAEAEAYNMSITVNDAMISDLTGIEAFTNLAGFSATGNSLTEVDLSGNTALTVLHLNDNQLTSLDVSNNTMLTHLQVNSNQLSSIDVSMLTNLRQLWVKDNQLTGLNTSSNTLITDIECGENMITSLDLSSNTALTTIQTHENNLTALDVSNNPQLFRITAFYNDLTSIDLSNNTALTSVNFEFNQLSSIDVSMLPILTSFKVRGNGESLVSANLKNGNNTNFTGSVLLDMNPNLTCVQVDDPVFSETNWTFVDDHTSFSTDCDVVEFVDANFEASVVANNSINTDGDDFIQTSEANAFTGQLNLTALNISDLTGLAAFENITSLQIGSNPFTSVDLSGNTKLVNLFATSGSYDALDVSPLSDLTNLYVGSSNQTSLDVSQNQMLDVLEIYGSPITTLDVSGNIALTRISVDMTALIDLNLSSNTNLTGIFVTDNSMLASLNLKNGNNTSIGSMELTGNSSLTCVSVDDISYLETTFSEDIDQQVLLSTDCSNDATDITAFSFTEQVLAATIDDTNHTIAITVDGTADITNLTPTITISDGATISPTGAQDFSSPVTYSITAEDNSTVQDWVVTVMVQPLGINGREVSVYPNPTDGSLTLDGLDREFTASVLTMEGKLIKRTNQKFIDLTELQDGLYLIKIKTEDGSNQLFRVTKTN